jgi:hypothetical protein
MARMRVLQRSMRRVGHHGHTDLWRCCRDMEASADAVSGNEEVITSIGELEFTLAHHADGSYIVEAAGGGELWLRPNDQHILCAWVDQPGQHQCYLLALVFMLMIMERYRPDVCLQRANVVNVYARSHVMHNAITALRGLCARRRRCLPNRWGVLVP